MEATKNTVAAQEINTNDVEPSVELQCVRELTALELSLVGGGAGQVAFI